jgi:hypothetical protein
MCVKFTEVEAQARQEVARAMNETREAKMERDIALKDLHNSHLDLQSWKQELAASKAAVRLIYLVLNMVIDQLCLLARSSRTDCEPPRTLYFT